MTEVVTGGVWRACACPCIFMWVCAPACAACAALPDMRHCGRTIWVSHRGLRRHDCAQDSLPSRSRSPFGAVLQPLPAKSALVFQSDTFAATPIRNCDPILTPPCCHSYHAFKFFNSTALKNRMFAFKKAKGWNSAVHVHIQELHRVISFPQYFPPGLVLAQTSHQTDEIVENHNHSYAAALTNTHISGRKLNTTCLAFLRSSDPNRWCSKMNVWSTLNGKVACIRTSSLELHTVSILRDFFWSNRVQS